MKNILCALFLMIISVNVVFAYSVAYSECTNLTKANCLSNESCIWNDELRCSLNECAKLSTEHDCKQKAKCSWESNKCRLRCSSKNSDDCANEGGCYWVEEIECSVVQNQNSCEAIPTCTWKRAATQADEEDCYELYYDVDNYIDECKNLEYCAINHLAACVPLTEAGCYPKAVTQKCQLCPQGYYCEAGGTPTKCQEPGHSTESTGSKSYEDCGIFCNVYNDTGNYAEAFCKAAPGCYWDDGSCKKCAKGYYCTTNSDKQQKCPLNSTSDPGATSREDCYHDSTTAITATGGINFRLPVSYQVKYKYPHLTAPADWPSVQCTVKLPVSTEEFCK